MKKEVKYIKEEPQMPMYKNKGKIQITFTNYAIRKDERTIKLSISKEMQKKFKVKRLNFLMPNNKESI